MAIELKHLKTAEMAGVKDVDMEERTVTSTITTDSLDSDLDVVMTEGLDFQRFRKNPTVFFMHDPFSIIGKSLWQKVQKGAVLAKTRFADNALGEEIFQLVAKGFLRGWSIGLDPMTLERREPNFRDVNKRPDWKGCRSIIAKGAVFEYSCVSLPANQDALNRAVGGGKFETVQKYMKAIGSNPIVREVKRIVRPRTLVRPVKKRVRTADELIDDCIRRRRGQY